MHDPVTWPRRLRRALILGATTALAAAASTASWASETITYTYDARGRVKQVSRTGTPTINNNVATSYTYDKADNRTNKTTTGSSNPPPP